MNTPLILPNPHLFPPQIARAATADDLAALAASLRPECDREYRAVVGTDPLEAMTADLDRTFVIEDRVGLPLAAILVTPVLDSLHSGAFHIAVSSEVTKFRHGRNLAWRANEAVVALHSAGYDCLYSFVDVRNVSTATLLVGCGFCFSQRFDKFGSEALPFALYTSRTRATANSRVH